MPSIKCKQFLGLQRVKTHYNTQNKCNRKKNWCFEPIVGIIIMFANGVKSYSKFEIWFIWLLSRLLVDFLLEQYVVVLQQLHSLI